MEVLEARAFRIALTIVTIIALFFVLRQCSTGETAGGEVRSGATDETTDDSLTPTVTLEPTAPVVVQATPIEDQSPNVVTYPVQSGDTLNEIAIKFNITIDVIMRANPNLDANALQVGQKLQLPGVTLEPSDLANPAADRDEGVSIDYYVQDGDTLGIIADEYTVSLQSLLDANPTVDPALIQVGQKVIVPPVGTGIDPIELTPQPTVTPIPRVVGEPQYEIVQPGDTLGIIASRWGITLDALMGANDIDDPDTIFVGLELLIPPPPAA